MQKITPWSTERCIAVARALYSLAQLQATQASDSAFQQFQEQQADQLVKNLIPKVATAHQDAATRYILMGAMVHILKATGAYTNTLPIKDQPKKKELVLSLIDLLVGPALLPHGQQATSDHNPTGLSGSPNNTALKVAPGGLHTGVPQLIIGGDHTELPQLTPGGEHTGILGLIASTLEWIASCLDQDADICSHFWHHAIPLIPQWFQMSATHMPHETASEESFASICVAYSKWHPKAMPTVPAPKAAALAMQTSIWSLTQDLLRQAELGIRSRIAMYNSEESDKSAASTSQSEARMAEIRNALDFLGNEVAAHAARPHVEACPDRTAEAVREPSRLSADQTICKRACTLTKAEEGCCSNSDCQLA